MVVPGLRLHWRIGYTRSYEFGDGGRQGGGDPLPKGIRDEVRPKEGDLLFVETNPDGSIVLRPAPPVREYSEEDLVMFVGEDEMTPAERERFLTWLGREPRLFGR